MALTRSFTITQQDGGLTAIAVNTTVYGSPNQDRDDAAEYTLWSKTNSSGARTFHNPDQGNVLTNLQYEMETEEDGWYELINLRIQPYNAGANYVEEQSSGGEITQYASMFYYGTTSKVYKAIAPSTGQDPENPIYFVEVPIESFNDNLNNTNIEVYYQDFYCEYRTNVCIRDKDDANCSCGHKNQDYVDGLYSLKQSADTNFANGNPETMEKIIRQLEADCTQC
jgi:hypothetical protein